MFVQQTYMTKRREKAHWEAILGHLETAGLCAISAAAPPKEKWAGVWIIWRVRMLEVNEDTIVRGTDGAEGRMI